MNAESMNPRNKTVALPNFNKGLMQARHIQAKLNGREFAVGAGWGPATYGAYVMPLSRRAE